MLHIGIAIRCHSCWLVAHRTMTQGKVPPLAPPTLRRAPLWRPRSGASLLCTRTGRRPRRRLPYWTARREDRASLERRRSPFTSPWAACGLAPFRGAARARLGPLVRAFLVFVLLPSPRHFVGGFHRASRRHGGCTRGDKSTCTSRLARWSFCFFGLHLQS